MDTQPVWRPKYILAAHMTVPTLRPAATPRTVKLRPWGNGGVIVISPVMLHTLASVGAIFVNRGMPSSNPRSRGFLSLLSHKFVVRKTKGAYRGARIRRLSVAPDINNTGARRTLARLLVLCRAACITRMGIKYPETQSRADSLLQNPFTNIWLHIA